MKNHAAIILHNRDKILFVKRAATKKSLPNIWAFPSGTMEVGETAPETVLREAKEELAIDVEIEKVLAEVELPEFDSKLYFVLCRSGQLDAIKYDRGEIQDAKWLTLKDFFNEFSDDQIGHGLVYLRKHPELTII